MPRAARLFNATTTPSAAKGTKVSDVSVVQALNLAPTVREALQLIVRDHGTSLTRQANTEIFRAGDPAAGLHLVVSGVVRVVRQSGDRQTVVHEERAGGLLGVVAFFGDGTYPATAYANEASELILLPGAAVRDGMNSSPVLATWLLSWMAQRTREVIGRLDHVAHKTVRQRVAAHLMQRVRAWELANGTRRRGQPVVSLGMTQHALAAELGTLKPLVVRALAALRNDGVIESIGRGQYLVSDSLRLEREAH
ncbi:MAG: Crp/Fnr family transcriptional regulator [Gemmatimonadaceae bacterium]|nr:Crp/Fnr family transcriptional regulator [Gemmatimonadaceae bacterium]